jgi:hypothetical protein
MNSELIIQNRKYLHQVVQLVGAFPRSLLQHDPSDETASLLWNADISGLVSQEVTHVKGSFQVGLSFSEFQLIILQDDKKVSALDLHGGSVMDGLKWLKEELAKMNFDASKFNLDLPYEIEKYDLGSRLHPNDDTLKLFSELYQLSHSVLDKVAAGFENAYDIRCWPDHFDLATLLPLAYDNKGAVTKSFGVGLSPGDDGITEPYMYVNVWPELAYELLSKHNLIKGIWNQFGWSGAVLSYSQFAATDQQQTIAQFIRESMAAIKQVN